ncbi:MAG: tyrosine--tRNA ligase [Acidimicrobiia bacterium]|nr:tyrosine--tRNA ligase [Acidimicrobiia bacterium]
MDIWGELEWRGAVAQSTDPGLPDLLRNESLTVYLGIDVTADSLHVGHLFGLMNLARLQRAGHRPIALLGGGTTLIGDPSGREEERPLLDDESIRANAEAIRAQVERFVDLSPGTGLLVNNAEWLRPLRLTDFLRDVGKHFTVNVMIAKESVRARLEEREQGISYTEFSYMLLQAYDFLHLFNDHGCRLQIGGSDQWGNITAGIELIRRTRGDHAYGLTFPLITSASGRKFSKSDPDNPWLSPERTSPYRFFQYWLNTDDRDVGTYLRLLTDLPREEVDALDRATTEHPERREAQQALAADLTARVHGEEAAAAARRASDALFGGDPTTLSERELLEVFADAPSTEVPRSALGDGGLGVIDLAADVGLEGSKSAARRTLDQGGLYVNSVQERDPDRRIREQDLVAGRYLVLRKGRKRYHLVRFG